MLQSSLNITNKKGFLTTRSLSVSTSMSKIFPNLQYGDQAKVEGSNGTITMTYTRGSRYSF